MLSLPLNFKRIKNINHSLDPLPPWCVKICIICQFWHDYATQPHWADIWKTSYRSMWPWGAENMNNRRKKEIYVWSFTFYLLFMCSCHPLNMPALTCNEKYFVSIAYEKLFWCTISYQKYQFVQHNTVSNFEQNLWGRGPPGQTWITIMFCEWIKL